MVQQDWSRVAVNCMPTCVHTINLAWICWLQVWLMFGVRVFLAGVESSTINIQYLSDAAA